MTSKQGTLLRIILASLLLHALLLYLLAQEAALNVNYPNKQQQNTQVKPIQARLLFTFPKESSANPQQAPPPTPPIQEQLEPFPRTRKELALDNKNPQKLTDIVPIPSTAVEALKSENNQDRTGPPVARFSVTELAKKHLSGLEQGQVQRLSRQAAKDYQQQKISPKLTGKALDPFVTEDEKLRASTRIRVNCSGSANQAASLLSGLFGGTLTCSKPPALKGFIEDRLNKSRHLPGKYQSEKNP